MTAIDTIPILVTEQRFVAAVDMIQTLVTELRSVASVVMIPAEQRSEAATLRCWHCQLSPLFMVSFCL